MKTKCKMNYKDYLQYIQKIQEYNSTLLVGITKCFTNQKVWYKCNICYFYSKHKHDTMRHYIRIHVNNGKTKFHIKK